VVVYPWLDLISDVAEQLVTEDFRKNDAIPMLPDPDISLLSRSRYRIIPYWSNTFRGCTLRFCEYIGRIASIQIWSSSWCGLPHNKTPRAVQCKR
jgi:hypothetical protein